jgi:hypothetical protein
VSEEVNRGDERRTGFIDLAATLKSAEIAVRQFYVFEHRLNHVDHEEFQEVWNRSWHALLPSDPLPGPILFIDVSAYHSFGNEPGLYLAGLATLTPEGFMTRQILPAEAQFQKGVIDYVRREFDRARNVAALAPTLADLKSLGIARAKMALAPREESVALIDVSSLARRFLPKDKDFARQLAELKPDNLELNNRGFSEVFERWVTIRAKPADEAALLARALKEPDPLQLALRLRFRATWGRRLSWSLPRDEYDPDQAYADVGRLIAYNRIRLAALVRTFTAACRAATDPGRQSATALLSTARKLQQKGEWSGAEGIYRTALARAGNEDERIECELKLSMFFKATRRWVEALELWNKLADAGVLKAMQELVLFYERVDHDPRKVLSLCAKFHEMGANEVDDGWLDHHSAVVKAKLAGRQPPKRQFNPSQSWDYGPHVPGTINVGASQRKGRIVRYPKSGRG